MTDLMDTAEPAQAVGTAFTALMLVEGLETSDGRLFELGTTTWRQTPIPFMIRDTAVHGPGETPAPTWVGGQIDSIERDPTDPSRILGRGHLIPNADGQRAEEIARHGFRGVSIDGYGDSPVPPDEQVTVVDQDGIPAAVLTRYADTVIDKLTLVPTSALEGCCLWFDDEPMPPVAAELHGAVVDPNAAPDVVVITDPYEQLVASAGGPLNPPREWFFTPEPDEYQPLEVSADGHVTGHIARAGQCHLSNKSRCDTAPPSTSIPPYKSFHRTTAKCADDPEVACGWLTVDAKHDWNFQHTAAEAADHYDHTGTLAAKIRLSNGRHGVWASGTLLPGLDDRTLAILQGPEVSGDWRRWQDPDNGQWFGLEVQGVLAVPFPAFPGTRTRPELLVASGTGEVEAQVGFLEPCDCDEELPMDDELAQVTETALEVESEREPALVASAAVNQVDVDYADALIASMDDTPVPLTPQERAAAFTKYDRDTRAALATTGEARVDGTIVIVDLDDLHLQIRAAATDPTTTAAVRRHISRRATALARRALLPSGWNDDGTLAE
jgi:hypothetical protein